MLPDLAAEDRDWHQRAACAGLLNDPEWADAFFPTRNDADDAVDLADAARFTLDAAHTDNHGTKAKKVCATCPVWRECLTGAVDRAEGDGIWGGAGGSYLRHLRRQRRHSIEAWQAALTQHRRILDYLVGRGPRPAVTNRNGPGAEHGRIGTYAKGCRCSSCAWAAAGRGQVYASGTSSDATSGEGEAA